MDIQQERDRSIYQTLDINPQNQEYAHLLNRSNSETNLHSTKRIYNRKEIRAISRKKKTDMLKDLRIQQKRFHIENQLQLIEPTEDNKNKLEQSNSASINADVKVSLLDQQAPRQSQGCCSFWGIFRRKNKAIEKPNISKQRRKSNRSRLISKTVQDWIIYMEKNLKQIQDTQWSNNLKIYLKKNLNTFQSTKFRSQIYYLNYTKQAIGNQLQSVPGRARMETIKPSMTSPRQIKHSRPISTNIGTTNNDDHSSKEVLRMQQRNTVSSRKNTVNRENENDHNNEYVIEYSVKSVEKLNELGKASQPENIQIEHFVETKSDDELSDIYAGKNDLQESQEWRLRTQFNFQRYLYQVSDLRKDNELLETMELPMKTLFDIIKHQLMHEQNPLNVVCQTFAQYFIKQYKNVIITDQSEDNFYLISEQENDQFELTSINPLQRQIIEQSLINNLLDEYLDQENDNFSERIEINFQNETRKQKSQQHHRNISRISKHKKSSNKLIELRKNIYRDAKMILQDIKVFSCIIYGCCIRFYSTVIKSQELENMKEDLIETLMKCVQGQRLANFSQQVCSIITMEEDIRLQRQINKFRNVKLIELGLNPMFCLDETSNIMDLFNEQVAQEISNGDIGGSSGNQKKSKNHKPTIKDLDSTHKRKSQITDESKKKRMSYQPFLTEQSKQGEDEKTEKYFSLRLDQTDDNELFYSILNPSVESEEDDEEEKLLENEIKSRSKVEMIQLLHNKIEKRLSVRPYEIAIQEFRKILNYPAPLDKMRCILRISKIIVKNINAFWKGISIDRDKLTIDADSILGIYIFIIINSDIPNLMAQIKFMQTFSTPYVQNITKLGYCLDTLNIALNHILNMDQTKLMNWKSPNEFDRDEIISERRSLTKSYRESIISRKRVESLRIQDDPFDSYKASEGIKLF
ncbi:UNKNOWN [Stylonychia lemnae]|uniref:VPS9 domain-containing protein n=1 Tax=Stylonychia lemnae TaxID=5949 RepID=A0A078ADE5_STYLE|nr:UNKNOWN [Stylonychia lemnae]|eukprot:CDW80265.1 UNKNOWN [Stylonychia lemnae]